MTIQEAINYVNAYIKQNGNRDITGAKMNTALLNILAAMTDDMGNVVIDDATTELLKTWSSDKISAELTERDADIDTLSSILVGFAAPVQRTGLVFESFGYSGHPARRDGAYSISGYYRRYTFDLTGMYAQGFRRIKFYGFSHLATYQECQGIVASAINQDNSVVVESYVPNITNYQEGWVELPITENSVQLIATVLNHTGVDVLANNFSNPSFVPTYVELSGIAGGIVQEIEDLDDRVTAIEGGVSLMPTTYVPSTLYGVIGDTMQEFVRGMVGSIDPYRYYSMFKCDQGKVFKRYFELTPAKENGAIPTLTMQHHIIDDAYNEGGVKTSDIVLCDPPTTSPASNINILGVGASTTNSGVWLNEFRRRLCGTGGTPVGRELTNISFVGRKSGYTITNIKCEATGGWYWGRFFTPRPSYRFIVSGNPTVAIGTQYSFVDIDGDTNIGEVVEVNVNNDPLTDNILLTIIQGSGAPQSQSGTLTKYNSGGGDSPIAYTSWVEESWAPFTDGNGNPSFVQYAHDYCNDQIDVVMCLLGSINSGIGHATSLTSTIADMKTFIDTLHADFPNAKVLIGTVNQVSAYYGLEDDYGASTTKYTTWNIMCGARRYVQAVDDFIHNEEDPNGDPYSNYCFMVNTATEVDSEYVFPTTLKAVNTRMSGTTEEVGTNGAHPTNDGLYMVADSFYRTFVNTILN